MKIASFIYVGGAVVYTIGAAGTLGRIDQLGPWLHLMFNRFANGLLWPLWLVMDLMGK